MSDAELILKTITSTRPDDGTVSAAMDALREDAGEDWIGAAEAVVTAWRAAIDAEQLRAAAELIRHDAPLRYVLMRDILNHVGIEQDQPYTSLIVAGNQAPLSRVVTYNGSAPNWGQFLVLVGARWLLQHAKNYQRQSEKTPARSTSPRE